MTTWNASSVFGVCVLVFFLPVALIGMGWFWHRRAFQPIKARSPFLVIVTDIVLVLYVVVLCVQRMTDQSYPCLLNVWSGYVGTVILFNTYVWRCWTLYFTFHLTQQKLLNASIKELPFFIRNRHYISGSFLFKLLGTVTVVLILPCGILTANNPQMSSESGDGCDKQWGDSLLAGYVAGYVFIFLIFALNLRQVADNFKIKLELKFSGLIGVVAVIPWFIFNNSAKDVNQQVFPFSTLFLILAIVAAFAASTLWPLYRSIFNAADPLVDVEVPTDLSQLSLHAIISMPAGLECFKKFLTKEFSVENILFYEEIAEFRRNKRKWISSQEGQLRLIGEARRIYAKYIITDAPFQVNLPDLIVKNLEHMLKHELANASQAVARMSVDLQAMRVQDDGSFASNSQKNNQSEENSQHAKEEKMQHAQHPGGAPTSSPSASASGSLGVGMSMPAPMSLALPAAGGPNGSGGALGSGKYDFLEHSDCPTIFDVAQKNIYMLMESDSAPRFLRSELYREWITEMSKKHHTRNVLQQMNII